MKAKNWLPIRCAAVRASRLSIGSNPRRLVKRPAARPASGWRVAHRTPPTHRILCSRPGRPRGSGLAYEGKGIRLLLEPGCSARCGWTRPYTGRSRHATAAPRQAAVVLMFSAVSSGLVMGSVIAADWTINWAYSSDTEVNLGLFVDIAAGHAGSITVAHIAAWPIGTTGLWFASKRLTAPGSQAVGLGQVARALAFAQAPAIAGGAIVFPVVVGRMLLGHTGAPWPGDLFHFLHRSGFGRQSSFRC